MLPKIARSAAMQELVQRGEGLAALDLIDVESHYDGITRRAERFYVVPYNIPEQNLASYFPEMNVLVPINHFADGSNTPISKSIVVTVSKRLDQEKDIQ